LQTVTKAYIRIEQHKLPFDDALRPLYIVGGGASVTHAKQLIQKLMNVQGAQYKDQVSQLLDQANATNTVMIEIPQISVGRLKGWGRYNSAADSCDTD